MLNLVETFYANTDNLINSMTDDGKLYYIGRLKTSSDDNFSQAFAYTRKGS